MSVAGALGALAGCLGDGTDGDDDPSENGNSDDPEDPNGNGDEPRPCESDAVARAEAAYEAMQEYFYRPDSGLYDEHHPEGDLEYSTAWPFSQALGGTMDLAGIRCGVGDAYTEDVEDRLSAMEIYWNGDDEPGAYEAYVRGEYGPGGDVFYDDNLWIGLELVRHHRVTGDEAALDRAREIFDLVVSAWVDDDSWASPGGVRWKEGSTDRNVVSNAPAAKLGLRLYQLTEDPDQREYYLSWSRRMYEWVEETLRAPSGLYWDHISPDGTITEWIFTYCQGVMIGASVLLADATDDETYLDRAEDVAEASLSHFGQDDRLYEEDMDFSAIFFKNLLLLHDRRANPEYRETLESYVDRLWDEDVDADTVVQRGEAGSSTHLLRQSALVQLCASLAWVESDYHLF